MSERRIRTSMEVGNAGLAVDYPSERAVCLCKMASVMGNKITDLKEFGTGPGWQHSCPRAEGAPS